MGLFAKKYCDICGGKIGLLGNRKLEDGNMCKDCARKLSPFFSDRRRSTVPEIEEQLAYREQNWESVAKFNVTRVLGLGTKVMLDEDAEKFIVTSSSRWQKENPDVLDFTQVTGCNIDVNEQKRELKQKDKDGKEVSFKPPRYIDQYDFYVTILVNSPWFDEIRFALNDRTIEVDLAETHGRDRGGSRGRSRTRVEPGDVSAEYRKYETIAREIKRGLMQARREARDSKDAGQSTIAQTCPHCGATTIPDSRGRCEHCGNSV